MNLILYNSSIKVQSKKQLPPVTKNNHFYRNHLVQGKGARFTFDDIIAVFT